MNPRRSRAERAPVAPPADFVDGLKLYVDPSKLNPDLDYTWVRDEVLGQPDAGSRTDAIRRGFVPVTHAEIGGKAIHWPGAKDVDDYVRDAGTILCARPKALADRERARIAAETKEQMENTLNPMREFRQNADPKFVQPMADEGVHDLGTQRGRFADA
jgi:hypothetical protein